MGIYKNCKENLKQRASKKRTAMKKVFGGRLAINGFLRGLEEIAGAGVSLFLCKAGI
jgi:hypothetical protein